MKTQGRAAPAPAELEAPHERVEAELQRLRAEAKSRTRAQAALRPLARPRAFDDLKKLERKLAALREKLGPELVEECRLGALLEELEDHRQAAARGLRKSLGLELREACAQADLELRVVSREDPVELRIPPLAVRIDFDQGLAELCFARRTLRSAPARAQDIVKAHRAAMKALDRALDPAAFFERCWSAYRATLVAQGRRTGERVELADFMAHMALQMQPRKFLVDPVAENYRGYSRAQFAYDVHRLRKAGGLTCKGRRINFGVATGTSASNESRVLYMEDGDGNGEYKLTIYFTEG